MKPTLQPGLEAHARFDVDRLQLQVEGITTFFRSQTIMVVEVRD